MHAKKNNTVSTPLRLFAIIGILLIIFFYPRFIVNALGENNPWASYLYQYGLGLIVFLVGLWLIRATGACQPGRGHDRLWWWVLIGGFIFFTLLHGLWIVLALSCPVYGGTV